MLASKLNDTTTIREILETDLALYRDLRLEALKFEPGAFSADYEEERSRAASMWLERLRGIVQDHMQTLFVAEDNAALIGMIGIARGKSAKTKHTAGIWGVYVRPAHRATGIATALLGHALLWAQHNNVSRVELSVTTHNARALALYKQSGFNIAGTVHDVMRVNGQPIDEFLLERMLPTD
jgi:RimJ/RimL family protein N-acetyltransferase